MSSSSSPPGHLPVLVNLETNQEYVLSSTVVTVGRAPDNTIELVDDDYASGEHAKIYFDQGRWWLEDLMSSNGTTVNGNLISQPYMLVPKDVLKFGRTSFRIQ